MSTSRASSLEKTKTQMQTLTRTYMLVINNYDHIATMDENMNWMKLTRLLSKKNLYTLGPPFVHLLLQFKKIESLSRCTH